MTDKAVEAVARAICSIDAHDKGLVDKVWKVHKRDAQAAIAAYRQHLADEGMVIVPSEPTFQQMLRGADSGRLKHCNPTCDEARTIYRAMISAHDCTNPPDEVQ